MYIHTYLCELLECSKICIYNIMSHQLPHFSEMVLDGHAEDALGPVPRLLVHRLVEPGILCADV